jgi:hypothetical protein
MTKGDSRNALCIGVLFAAASWMPIGDAPLRAKAPKESHTYANGSELVLSNCLYCTSSVSLRIGDGCVDVSGALGWGGFFYKLKRKMTADGPVFRVGHRTVTNFPDEVRLFVGLISGFPCSRGAPAGAAIPSLETLKSPRAEAVYIRDMKMHPLEITLSEEGNTPPPNAPPVALNRVWHYRFQVNTKGVLLTDALVITLYSKEGKKFAELTWRQ